MADCERKRAKNQEMFRADAMTLEELRAALAALSKVREEAFGDRRSAGAGRRTQRPRVRPSSSVTRGSPPVTSTL